MLESYVDVLETKDICRILKIGKRSAYQILQSGELPSRRIGRIYKVSKVDLLDYLCRKTG